MNEANRLAAMRRLELLDTPPEAEFDDLVEIAALVCETPISLMTLLDERRQWFKAKLGLEATETSRDEAFCAHAIQQPEMFVVDDATQDQLFAENLLVTGEMGIRFYAGMPIYSPEGAALGTLCVMDRVPRRLNENQFAVLRLLAKKVNDRLLSRDEMRARKQAFAEAEEAREAELKRYQADLEAANARLRELATTDPLTGLCNRRVFDERLIAEFTHARRYDRPLSVMMLDVDNFKQRNDRFGHDEGDATLVQLAELLRRSVREADLVVRYGGEEFVLLLPETDEAHALMLAERILAAVRAERWQHEQVTVSCGVADLRAATGDRQELVSCADEALYKAKRAGKDRVVGYLTKDAKG
jgi:diguanylate cyclase (GGDEF)-like protein